MISGLYSAATAMEASQAQHEISSENLANIDMPGFRRRVLTESSFESMLPPDESTLEFGVTDELMNSHGVSTGNVQYDFSQGQLKLTSRPMDVAISGAGFFSVAGPSETLYTRNGSFHVNAERELVTIDNLPVQGTGGTIRLPGNVTTESVQIMPDGRLTANGVEFGQLAVTQFADLSGLRPAGATLFKAPPEANPQLVSSDILQGFLERANVSSISEMVDVIAGTRHYEAAQKALTAIAESVQKRIGLR